MKRLLLLHFQVFFLLSAWTQEPQLYFEKITTQHGLSHNKVNCILQDKRGFIWMGTDDGLNRYDGHNFTLFRNRTGDTSSVSGNMITDILEDSLGILWIATADGGISRYDYRLPPRKQFRQFRHYPGKPSIPVNIINALLDDKMGYLWLATSGRSVIRFDKKKEIFQEVIPTGTRTAIDLCLDKDGNIWAGRQGGGLLKINPRTLGYQEDQRYRDLYAQLPHASITALYRDHSDNMWVGSWDKVMYRYHPPSAKPEVFKKGSGYSFAEDEIRSFGEDRSKRLWMGGKEKGLHIYDHRTNRFYRFSFDPSREGSVADNQINCIFTDAQGRVWLGTNKGVSVNNPVRQQFQQSFLNTVKENSPITIYDFYEDRKNSIWIGTSKGIFIKKNDGSLEHRPLVFKSTPLHITCFFEDEDGLLYLGTDYSLFLYEPDRNKLTILPNTEKDGVMKRIIDSRVVSIVKDRIDGNPVLLTSPYGHYLAYYDLKRQRWISRLDSSMNIIKQFNLEDNLIRKFFKTGNGMIWMATAKSGLGHWSIRQNTRARFLSHHPGDPSSIASNNVYDMVEDDKGNLWVGTYGGGLHYFNTATKRFSQISGSDNLVEGLQLDGRGNVWMISNGQLNKYDPVSRSHTRYQLPDIEKTGGIKGKIFRDSKGRFYVAGMNYFISFHPDSVLELHTPPRVFLTDFTIFNSSYSHLLGKDKIRLSFRENYFTIEFTAPEYSPGSEVRYAYQLQGFDKEWVDIGTRNRVSYSNLEGGTYTFRVKASNVAGVWSGEQASIRIEIIPPYWKRAWFFILVALIMVTLVYAIYRYRINELLKRQAIRNRIARDLHDNVGSTLSSISVYSQVAKIYHQQQKQEDLQATLEKISSTSSDMISELNDTVWAINPNNDRMEIILQRMDSYARPLLKAQDINLHFNYQKEIIYLELDMEKRKNLYLIFKEAVNNTLKYSDSRNLYITLELKVGLLSLTIRDDGKGFDLTKTSEGFKSSDVFGGGNGLRNMQLRANEMKGHLGIESQPGKGTTVILNFPIT